ncbi:2-hydroxyacid dehydrogenase [Clostridium brassicae]|uniref:2-hydroxyacid dehydrogenase n=1 Tax=Clostridium brassicae TaxID=2999072 RepID=A0ABT4D4D5_9CLOT|nr:2-hydroxyacid dehydrogenase [Clostridium brassicae]MCY6957134.1 2-hydroxyacid dehydrogenase [Clostridium brassicae]
MRIVMLEPLGISQNDVQTLSKSLTSKGHEFVPCYKKIETNEGLLAQASGADIFIIANSPLNRDIIESAPNLKMISVAFTGIDHVDIATCKEKGITICNAAGYSTNSVAELTFGLILSTFRNIIPCDIATRESKTKAGLVGNELYGKTLGIIGTGSIGKRVAEIGKAFGCKLLGYSRTQREDAKNIGITYVTLENLLKESDIVSLHVPLTDETKLLINKKNLSLMKPSSILINAARGGVVDSEALANALNNEKIAGAGIDVFEMEPPIPTNHPLLNAKNVVLTPHAAFATDESMLKRAEITFGNITKWLEGNPQNLMKL